MHTDRCKQDTRLAALSVQPSSRQSSETFDPCTFQENQSPSPQSLTGDLTSNSNTQRAILKNNNASKFDQVWALRAGLNCVEFHNRTINQICLPYCAISFCFLCPSIYKEMAYTDLLSWCFMVLVLDPTSALEAKQWDNHLHAQGAARRPFRIQVLWTTLESLEHCVRRKSKAYQFYQDYQHPNPVNTTWDSL